MAHLPPTDISYTPLKKTVPLNLSLAQEYFDTLPEDDINKQYYNGLTYNSCQCFLGKLWNYTTIHWKRDTLSKFYPYSKSIQESIKEVRHELHKNYLNAALFTFASWTLLYQLGKRGKVIPLFREYGYFLKTHRIFRHYLYTLAVPAILAHDLVAVKWADHFELCWQIHVNRLNQKNLTDPLDTEYPESLRGPRRFLYNTHYI